MYTLTLICGSTSKINIQDPYPADGGFSLSLDPGQTKITHLLNSEFDRIKPTLDQMVIDGLVSYTALDGPASELSNDSSVPGETIKDALDNLNATIVAMDIYVDEVAGSDITGDGTAGNPYASYDYADATVPENIDHKVHVKMKAGAYTSSLESVRHNIGPKGQYIVEGIDPWTVIESALDLDVVAEIGGYYQAHEWTSTGAGWTVDEHRHRFALMKTGANAGKFAAIYKNSADKLTLHGNTLYPSAGDTFDIVEPSTVITMANGCGFTMDIDIFSTPQYKGSKVGFGSIKFISTKASTQYGDFLFGGSGSNNACIMTINGCMFTATGHSAHVFASMSAIVNDFALTDPNAFDDSWLNDWTGAVFTVSTGNNAIATTNHPVYIGGSGKITALCSRGKIDGGQSSQGGIGLAYSTVAQWNPWKCSSSNGDALYIDTIGAAIDGLHIFGGEAHLSNIYIASAEQGIGVYEGARIILGDGIETDVVGVTDYAAWMDAVSSIGIKAGASTPEVGASGAIYWSVTAVGPVAWPSAGAGVTDGLGSFVTASA